MSSGATPLLPDVGIVAIVPDRWGPVWQSRHQVMTRLARYFRIVWVQPAEHWRGRRPPEPETSSPPPPGFRVHAGLVPGFRRPRQLADLVFDMRVRHARSTLRRAGCSRQVLYLWRPKFARALDASSFDLTCYHIDDEYSFSRVEVGTSDAESALIRAVDHVFIHSKALFEKKGHLNPSTSMAPNGVDFDSFAEPGEEPADLARIARPRIGYTGMVKRQLDWDLMRALVPRHPDWQFVFVGKRSDHAEAKQAIADLSAHGNAHFLGTKPVWELARYPGHFDACIMPYRQDDYTKYIFPLKVHEYLAGGRPVVGTRLPALEPLAHVVALAESADEWSEAIAAALRPEETQPDRVSARQGIARENDWDRIVERIARELARGLGGEVADSLAPHLDRAG